MTSSLNLFYEDKLVGVLHEDNEERLSFKYSKAWLGSEKAFPISIALKLDDMEYGHIQTKAFFENLLPEGEVKSAIEKLSHKNISDEFSFLKEFGIDCAGAFILSSEENIKQKAKFNSKEIKLEAIYEYLREKKPLTSTIINEEGGRFSLAGAQDKFPVIYKKKKLFIPLDGEATTYILKPFVRYHTGTEDTPYNEHFCMSFANVIGLNVPKTLLIEGDYPLYLVERFDRKVEVGGTKRIHQEDFCQAQGLTSRKKYEDDGGPTLSINYKLIKDNSSLPLKDLSQFLRWFWFNLFIGNNDCHSKNLSFLHTEEGLRLSPFYDLLSTTIYKSLTPKFSYSIGGQFSWHKLNTKHFRLLASNIGISEELLFKEGQSVISKFDAKLDTEVAKFNEKFEQVKTADKVQEEINKRISHLKKNIKEL